MISTESTNLNLPANIWGETPGLSGRKKKSCKCRKIQAYVTLKTQSVNSRARWKFCQFFSALNQHTSISTFCNKNTPKTFWTPKVEKSRLYWNFMVFMTFKSISFLSLELHCRDCMRGEKKRNNGWMDCWCIETTEPWKKIWQLDHPFTNQQSNADREQQKRRAH